MSTPTAPDAARTDAALCEARTDVKGEIARTDTKASLLIAFNGALLAGLTAAAPALQLTAFVAVLGGAGAVLLLVAAGLLLAVIRPRLKPAAPGSFPHLANLTPEEIRTELATDRRAENIAVLSRVAGLLLAAAAVAAWVGGAL